MHDLEHFRLADMVESGKQLRRMARSATSMEEAAGEMVDYFYESFLGTESGEHNLAQVRCFKTHAYGRLPEELQRVGRMGLSVEPQAEMRCLALLASRGEETAWNGRVSSAEHQVIPLQTAKMVEAAPMIAELIHQMGLDVARVVGLPKDLLLDLGERSFNVFHIEDALGSEFVPAQETFVVPYGVRSVVGMGGLLPSGELFAIVMFSKVRISLETAAMFRTLALSVKLVLTPFAGRRVFAE